MADIRTKTRSVEGIAPDAVPYDELMAAQEAVIMKGLARDWPLVQAGLSSSSSAMAELRRFYQGRPVVVYEAPADAGGRLFYTEDMTGLNFKAGRADLVETLERLAAGAGDRASPTLYIGSTDLDLFLPGLRAENDLVLNHPMFSIARPLASIWIGNQTTATAHFDFSHNLAVCVAGRRRFTLFPPEQVENLYPGPLEPTPGGQVVSMVDFRDPDFERFPRFKEAIAAGQVADLEPGDVLFYPAMWWHHVEAFEDFNILINYWWNLVPSYVDSPMNTLLHGLLSLRDRPAPEKAAWKALFDYYIFGPPERAGAHIPEPARGELGEMTEMTARRLRAKLLNKLNR